MSPKSVEPAAQVDRLAKIDSNETTNTEPSIDSAERKTEASWPAVLFLIHVYILGLYGVFPLFTMCTLTTAIFTLILILIGIMGVTCGTHRLWSHRSYEATLGLRIFLMLCQTMAGQGSIYECVRLHRLHHATFKQVDDPYFSYKNFVAAHVLAQVKSLSVRQQKLLSNIDMADIEADKVVMFQKRFYWILYLIFFVLLPINAPLEYWNDSVQAALFVALSLRYLIVLNCAWLVNSAHFVWGLDRNKKLSDSNMIFFVTKSYWPQYHYLMPWDYRSGEFGTYDSGCSTTAIRVFAALRLASNLQTITPEAVQKGLEQAVDTGHSISACIRKESTQLAAYDKYGDHFLMHELE